MQRLLIALVACLALALGAFAVGCGDDDDDGGETTAAETTAEETTGAETTGAETTGGGGEVAIAEVSGNLFEPAEATAAVGDTVVFTNEDSIAHNAIADNGEFESETMEQGDTFEWTVEGASGDTVSYVCTFHPGMEGTITVE